MFECNEIEMCICVLDQVSDDYVMMEMTWRSGGDSVFPLLFRMEEVIHYSWKLLFAESLLFAYSALFVYSSIWHVVEVVPHVYSCYVVLIIL